MDIDNKGNVVGHRICETLINVNRRMTYTNVKKILVDKEASVIEEYKELIPMFERMGELAAILRKKRFQRGSIDFDFPETKIILDKDGHPLEVKPYDRNVATKIIEEFMLMKRLQRIISGRKYHSYTEAMRIRIWKRFRN